MCVFVYMCCLSVAQCFSSSLEHSCYLVGGDDMFGVARLVYERVCVCECIRSSIDFVMMSTAWRRKDDLISFIH